MLDADLRARIDGIRQLGGVVRATTGIAGARARTARTQIAAVEGYAAILGAALSQAMAGVPPDVAERTARPALVVFCAEQGFVGGFSDRVLDDVEANPAGAELFLIGSRGARDRTGLVGRDAVPLREPAQVRGPRACRGAWRRRSARDLRGSYGLDARPGVRGTKRGVSAATRERPGCRGCPPSRICRLRTLRQRSGSISFTRP